MLKVVKDVSISQVLFGIRSLRNSVRVLWSFTTRARYIVEQNSEPASGAACFVLGNGPSLTMDLKEGLDILRMGDVVCVNSFAETDLYEKIQPKYYVLADPSYWSTEYSEAHVALRNSLFNQILGKTTWALTIYVPFEAKVLFEATFGGAQNIRLSFYNTQTLEVKKEVKYVLYDLGFSMPPPQNVMIPALFLALRLGYKKIILLGADHSWHQTLVLDEDNRLCVRQQHFYNSEAKLKPFSMGQEGHDGESLFFTMDKAFSAFARMFAGYREIEKYAKHVGAQIYNASSVTFIDAFKKITISDLHVELEDEVRLDK